MITIAIDGPSGSGKSTISKIIAKKIGFINVDTGALYRTIAYFFLENKINYKEKSEVLKNLNNISVSLKNENFSQTIFLNGVDVTQKIRTNEISMVSSEISVIPEVRQFLLKLQRDIAEKNNIVIDGRDIGTVVIPNADVKIFLTADPKVRAKRRYNQLISKGQSTTFDEILELINKRDYNDIHRKISPLKKADDAILVDNSSLNQKNTVDKLMEIIEKKGIKIDAK